ncbi:arylsulfatase B-like [Pomacea canaliculata]|uniref:arylsulfatase B-like n=1 Tax=Pomacea canaliculata TaxID=400727 RepID=UPI000D72539E|nr:arylsulfatase B-like [Pomacea canaliculata]XP_025077728.1 arylsulfatase B-like [Pomacea canaliculata]
MMTWMLLLSVLGCYQLRVSAADAVGKSDRPNILFLYVDDLGWRDVGYRDPTFRTPNIDALHAGSVRLNASYSGPNCSPSRAALLSAVHPFRWGLQDNGINAYSPAAIPLTHDIIPQAMKRLGYQTHMIGKWHQGSCKWEYTPTYRGYDSFVGIYHASGDYFTHVSKGGYDMRFNERVYWEANGTYSTTLYSGRAEDIIKDYASSSEADPVNTKPFFIMLAHQAIHLDNQVPPEYLDLCSHIGDVKRREKCAMMAVVDEGIGNITRLLRKKNLMNNLLIVFTSDNGGSYSGGSSNWPYKGEKTTLWEGGIKVPTFLYSESNKILPNTNCSWSGLFYTTDWYATLMGFATRTQVTHSCRPMMASINGKESFRMDLPEGKRWAS